MRTQKTILALVFLWLAVAAGSGCQDAGSPVGPDPLQNQASCGIAYSSAGFTSGGAAYDLNGDWYAVVDGEVFYNGARQAYTAGTESGGVAVNRYGDYIAVADGEIIVNDKVAVSTWGSSSGGAAIDDDGYWVAVADGYVYGGRIGSGSSRITSASQPIRGISASSFVGSRIELKTNSVQQVKKVFNGGKNLTPSKLAQILKAPEPGSSTKSTQKAPLAASLSSALRVNDTTVKAESPLPPVTSKGESADTVPSGDSISGGVAFDQQGDWLAVANGNIYLNGNLVKSTPGTSSGGAAFDRNGNWVAVVNGNIYEGDLTGAVALSVSTADTESGGVAFDAADNWVAVADGNFYRNGVKIGQTAGYDSGGVAFDSTGNWGAVANGDIYYNGSLIHQSAGTSSGGVAFYGGNFIAVADGNVYHCGF